MTDAKKYTVVLATGGTGGHIFPAEALAEVLLARGHKPVLITDKRFDERYQGALTRIPIHKITSASPSGSILHKIKALCGIAIGTLQTGNILFETRPHAVIGFGGYPSFPTLFAAQNRKFPVLIHEQNAVLGRVNKFFVGKTKAIATSFHKVKGVPESALRYTGNPVRSAFKKIRELPYPSLDDKIHILITGGSLGATVLGEVVPEAITQLPEDICKRLVITQQCRKNDIEAVRAHYKKAGIDATLESFFHDMPERIAAAHLVIGRAGASTVTELAVAGRPAIMIPYPHAMDDHQTTNANSIAEGGGGWIIKQSEFTPASLKGKLEELLSSPKLLQDAAAKAKALGEPNAAENLADLVEEFARS